MPVAAVSADGIEASSPALAANGNGSALAAAPAAVPHAMIAAADALAGRGARADAGGLARGRAGAGRPDAGADRAGKLEQTQTRMAAEAGAARVPRERPVLPPLDERPLLQVETRPTRRRY